MRSYRFDVVFDCGDGIGVMPVIATDEKTAWVAARSEFPGCKLALVRSLLKNPAPGGAASMKS